MRRVDRVKLLVLVTASTCIALHVMRCGCCGACASPESSRPVAVSPSGKTLMAPLPGQRESVPEPAAMLNMLASADTVAGSGFRQPNWMIWGGSVMRSADGLYHMFVSRWEERLGHNAWVTSSEVVHAVASSPLGPWRFRDVALPRRGRLYWDGMATHNPTVHWDARRREYALFYIGTSFDFEPPRDAPLTNRSLYELAWNSKRIGVATAASLDGPWRRSNAPIISPRLGHWDGGITSNPAVAILPNGSTLLFYKSIEVGYPERNERTKKPLFYIGAAISHASVRGPYIRMQEGPALTSNFTQTREVAAEDPYLWHCPRSGRLHLIFKAMQPVRRLNKSIAVPSGYLGYTYTSPGGSLQTWALPRLAFNRTLAVRDDTAALNMPRATPWWSWSWWSAKPGLAAVTSVRRRLTESRRRSTFSAPRPEVGVPVAEPKGEGSGLLTVDRLERPQMLFSGNTPTHCFAAMMLNGSSANVVLRLGSPRGIVIP